MKKGYSPEQITGRCRLEQVDMVSRQSIYRIIHATGNSSLDWRFFLRKKGKKRRHHSGASSYGIPNRVDISLRPADIDQRLVIGHW